MGCDIHLYMEYASSQPGVWLSADFWQQNDPLDGSKFSVPYELQLWQGRNYRLFSLLAGVRNYDEITPIAQPRGMPEDATELVRGEYDRWGVDAHSASWLTVAEITEWLKANPTTPVTGMVTAEVAESLDQRGEIPSSWCLWTNQPGAVQRSWIMPSPLIQFLPVVEARMAEMLHCELCDNEEDFRRERREKLFSENRAKFRLVFWFDN